MGGNRLDRNNRATGASTGANASISIVTTTQPETGRALDSCGRHQTRGRYDRDAPVTISGRFLKCGALGGDDAHFADAPVPECWSSALAAIGSRKFLRRAGFANIP